MYNSNYYCQTFYPQMQIYELMPTVINFYETLKQSDRRN